MRNAARNSRGAIIWEFSSDVPQVSGVTSLQNELLLHSGDSVRYFESDYGGLSALGMPPRVVQLFEVGGRR